MSTRGQYSCVLCEMKLNSKEALKEHFRKHANKKIDMRGRPVNYIKTPNTQCDICNQSFDTVRQTIRHRFKVHSNSSTKFHCSYCGMQFPLKNHRDNHEMSHDATESENKDRHRKCEECNLIFYNEKALDYHCRSIHKRHAYMFKPIVTAPPSNKIKLNSMNDAMSVYYCHLCGVEYVIKFNLQRHLENVHTQKERETVPDDFIKCTVCSAMFCSKKAYNVHNTYHQPDDLYVTSEQQRMQTVTKIDQDFDIRRVEHTTDRYIPKSSNLYKRTTIINHKTQPSKVPKTEIKIEIKRERSVSLEDDPLSINESSDSESDIPLDQRITS
ncbi:zinc finger and BTB domain-containing protein 41-like [Solenopsis invicta]|uniref:zinc finger and BTB domain-containing protein 41-like n=1 Tax=Solenopsis invicta TaxID=13686 RepID=UPI00193DCBEC|nr:zinc finger and BTB domain-containing protein 41-like [Solenopsis invicta]